MKNKWNQEINMNNIKLKVDNKEVSIAQHSLDDGEPLVQEVALIHKDDDMNIHPFFDLDSLIESLIEIRKELSN